MTVYLTQKRYTSHGVGRVRPTLVAERNMNVDRLFASVIPGRSRQNPPQSGLLLMIEACFHCQNRSENAMPRFVIQEHHARTHHFDILHVLQEKSGRAVRPLHMQPGRIPFEQEAMGRPTRQDWPFYG